MKTTVETVTSADGTTIAVERAGEGQPVIVVGGAFSNRSTVAGLAAVLSDGFTAVTYDRRGRGDSGDAASYAPEREIEDLGAVIGYAGGYPSRLRVTFPLVEQFRNRGWLTAPRASGMMVMVPSPSRCG